MTVFLIFNIKSFLKESPETHIKKTKVESISKCMFIPRKVSLSNWKQESSKQSFNHFGALKENTLANINCFTSSMFQTSRCDIPDDDDNNNKKNIISSFPNYLFFFFRYYHKYFWIPKLLGALAKKKHHSHLY